ncbi:DUF4861 domain-containing protein [Chryseobacterium suipulveris]|uniref:DUF4861 domain-containing protein n=1 Tax=Chryseobacterium suipulveris TaxID=2929800 RepID=A0ABY4BW85_9FLAO|nr:DUF4861 family protein [Chryseobacterium suipulveris]UOE41968.1 DUF4861 domain-containing protein [Chryseobacterium suipulveris]
MKISKTLFAVGSLALVMSCSTVKTSSIKSKNGKTYAEISQKEGGSWNGRKYSGGNFKNVQTLVLNPLHTDHSFDIRYEGPGWESNKIGYRLYLDWRNAIDIYGKKTEEIVLPNVGQDGFDSYHEMSDWGADILKVGKGLGIGAIGRVVNGEMLHFNDVEKTTASVENNKANSKVTVDYKGWKTNGQSTDFTSELTIFPDERYTQHTVKSSNALDGIVTGIVNLYKLPLIQRTVPNGKWGYIATYGKQTLFDDNLGMAVFYKISDTEEIYKGKDDYLIRFKPTTEKVTFYFLGAWEKEPNGIKTEKEFLKYLNQNLSKLNAGNVLK